MGLHSNVVLKNSCLKVPVNPVNKLPSASYERRKARQDDKSDPLQGTGTRQSRTTSFGEFYRSIPDYRDLTHLSNQEFYRRLEMLREDRHRLLINIDRPTSLIDIEDSVDGDNLKYKTKHRSGKTLESNAVDQILNKYMNTKNESDVDSSISADNAGRENLLKSTDLMLDKRKYSNSPKCETLLSPNKLNIKANSPSCSVSWNDLNTPRNESRFCDRRSSVSPCKNDTLLKKSMSAPTSPVKKRMIPQMPLFSRKDYDSKILSRLKDYTDNLDYKLLEKEKFKHFRAHPVPIESRIPLYEKILQDQELRRAISKLQSTAELQAQMKPFSFTEREEKYRCLKKLGCSRLYKSNPQLNTVTTRDDDGYYTKGFRARPIPKHIFSNYVYEKMKEDEFYRALNRKIRAEELLKTASLPPSMARREKRGKSCDSLACQKYHNGVEFCGTDTKVRKKWKNKKKNYENAIDNNVDLNIFKYESPCMKNNKRYNEDDIRKIYGSNSSDTVTPSSGYGTRPRSAVDTSSVNKSNLAAVLRIESSKKKLEADILKQLEEERFQSEIKWRDSVLRRKPAWKSLKYSKTDDLSLRLQMRRDEERLKRDQFLHDMEMMYGRVHNQPMMFERNYSPRKHTNIKTNKYHEVRQSEKTKRSFLEPPGGAMMSPSRLRKVSINETAETIGDDIDDLLYKSDDEELSKSSDEVSENIQHYEEETKSNKRNK